MAKVMLVEDDNSLREIYGARLQAEGYEIVSAKDGEEALAMAVSEKPDLIISDIMMPKISGFDMLDILRTTPETKNTKIIMMTALNQAEDKAHADRLGADRYLVKSQVTLEDVVAVAKEVLSQPKPGDTQAPVPSTDVQNETQPTVQEQATGQTSEPQLSGSPATTQAPDPEPPTPIAPPLPPVPDTDQTPSAPATSQPTPISVTDGASPAEPTQTPATDSVADGTQTNNDQVLADAVAKVSGSDSTSSSSAPTVADDGPKPYPPLGPQPSTPESDVRTSRVIQPISDVVAPKTDIHELLAQEEAKDQNGVPNTPPAQP